MDIHMKVAGDFLPGPPQKEGDRGCITAAVQTRLNTLSRTYPSVPPLTVDGIFGSRTACALRRFQALFGLQIDGIADAASWQALSEVYHQVLASSPPAACPTAPENCWQTGSKGARISALQYELNTLISRLPALPVLQTDGVFGGRMAKAVRLFQKAFGLPPDGVVCKETFLAIQKAYCAVFSGASTDAFLFPDRCLEEENALPVSPVPASGSAGKQHSFKEETVMQTPCQSERTVLPYPGAPIGPGASGSDTRQIQCWLNALVPFYPPLIHLQPDGIFGSATTGQVRLFQQMFALSADGVVGPATWSMLQLVQNDAAAGNPPAMTPNRPPQLLKAGSAGGSVRILQTMLDVIHTGYPDLPALTVDGIFGADTEAAVLAFQKKFCLNADGIVGSVTWAKIVAVYTEVYSGTVTDPDVYPGTPLQEGSRGSSVLKFQQWLNALAPFYPPLIPLAEDGMFGGKAKEQVKTFQRMFALKADGIVGEKTWNTMTLLQNRLPEKPPVLPALYGNTLLRSGSYGRDVRILQYLLNEAKALHRSLPTLAVDGSFGPATERAVRLFQSEEQLKADGIAGEKTWNRAVSCQPQKF